MYVWHDSDEEEHNDGDDNGVRCRWATWISIA
jgi:hypothetical protein